MFNNGNHALGYPHYTLQIDVYTMKMQNIEKK